jgi:hypothetical protein
VILLDGNKPAGGKFGRETSHIFRTKLISRYRVLFKGIDNNAIINLIKTFSDNYLQSARTI